MLSKLYNRIATTYDSDWNGIYRDSREININQIVKRLESKTIVSALDLAVGTGNVFHELSKRVDIECCIGNDISTGMLDQAKQKLNGSFVSICDDALNIERHIPRQSQDLILCHFIFSYVDPNDILERAYRLLKPGGLISIASSTQQALVEIHRDHFPKAGKLLAVDASLGRSYTPGSHQELCEIVNRHGFEILENEQYQKETSFCSFDDVSDWAMGSGWAAQYFDRYYWVKRLGARAWFASAKLLYQPFYPVKATNDISLILARRSI